MRIDHRLRFALLGLGLAGLSACASAPPRAYHAHRNVPAPGPPGDPWGPYIRQAASRFHLPEKWIRAVMRQESGGQPDLVSSAGAIGLMQVMPATYAELAARYGLGGDPYDPHDNMIAGVGYLRQMYDRYGSPNFLAAYNAGPGRVDSYLSGANDLPYETVNYVASISPYLGPATAPAVRYTAVDPVPIASPSRLAPRVLVNAPPCDPDAAYDPTRTCQDTPSSKVTASAPPCDPDAAYDPRRTCRPVPQLPDPPPQWQLASLPVTPPSVVQRSAGTWAIEVGTFPQPTLARDVATAARGSLPDLLTNARIDLPPTTPFGGTVLYRARLTALSATVARDACARLTQRGLGCVVVPPDQSS